MSSAKARADLALFVFASLAVIIPVFAVAAPETTPAAPAKPAAADPATAPEEEEPRDVLGEMGFKRGPLDGRVGSLGTLKVPESYAFGEPAPSRKFLEFTGNIPGGQELAIVVPEEGQFFVIFEFESIGYVKDDEKDALDADGLLKSLKEGQEDSNRIRKSKGLQPLELIGWHTPPHYDPATHNLEWGTLLKSINDKQSVNYNVRLLGRRGVMSVELVASPDGFATALPQFRQIVSAFAYTQGQDYASFKAGDKIAEYGLGALVAGGALAVAAKSGLLSKLWKVLILVAVAAGGFLKKLFGGRGKSDS